MEDSARWHTRKKKELDDALAKRKISKMEYAIHIKSLYNMSMISRQMEDHKEAIDAANEDDF